MSEALHRLAATAGIAPEYRDYWGRVTTVGETTKRALLQAMGYAVESDAEIANELARSEREEHERILRPTALVRDGETARIECRLPASAKRVRWKLTLEDGTKRCGSSRCAQGMLDLGALPPGYHRLDVRGDGVKAAAWVIAAPAACYLPPAMTQGRAWALATQLYALRSRRNWGMGDFGDLKRLAELLARTGGMVALNPLHDLHPHNPAAASPYAPSSRLFLNALYIDVEAVADLRDSDDARAAIAEPVFQARLQELRDRRLVDYPGVAHAKRTVLETLYAAFRRNHLEPASERAREFLAFVGEGAAALENLARYEALAEHFAALDAHCYGWQQWPLAYRSPNSDAVAAFATQHRTRVEFFLYLQWLADTQVAQAARAGTAPGALYRDLAVGVDLNGADAWADQRTLTAGASLGAPPDPLNALGQNWGLPPLAPAALRAAGYEPFARLLRTNMRHAAVLRIDHVMALARCFWIPRGAPAVDGAYVNYDLDAMLGVVALESVRNRCAVVGEDLGTLPGALRERLHDARLLSSRLLYFERDPGSGAFVAPERYPRWAAASVGTHDLPPLTGWWLGNDIALRVRLGLYPGEAAVRAAGEDRWAARFALIDALAQAGEIDEPSAARLRADAANSGSVEGAALLLPAVHRFLAATPCALRVVQLEDLLGEADAVNVPGTVEEHPNWCRKRAKGIEEIARDEQLTIVGALFAPGGSAA